MRRFKNILFLADGSKGENFALTRAVELANTNRAKLTILDVIEIEEPGFFDSKTNKEIAALRKTQQQERLSELQQLCETVTSTHPKLRVTADIQTGHLARAAILAVLGKHHDLVIKAPEGNTDKLKTLFGSTDHKLMRKCPCPVWIVKPSRKKHFQKILAAIDLNPVEPEKESLAKQIMAISTSLAKDEGSELHVVHAWRLAYEYKLRGRQINKDQVDELLREIKDASQSEVEGLTSQYPYKKRFVHLIKGRAEEVIPNFVEKANIDLVVIGTVGRSGIPGVLIGNTAERILNTIDCSVLTLKPEGFETPIKL